MTRGRPYLVLCLALAALIFVESSAASVIWLNTTPESRAYLDVWTNVSYNYDAGTGLLTPHQVAPPRSDYVIVEPLPCPEYQLCLEVLVAITGKHDISWVVQPRYDSGVWPSPIRYDANHTAATSTVTFAEGRSIDAFPEHGTARVIVYADFDELDTFDGFVY